MSRIMSTLAAVLLTTSAAWAQSLPDIWTTELDPVQQGAGNKMKGFTFGVRVETWRAALNITDSSPSGLDNAIDDPEVVHNALMFTGSYDIQVTPTFTVTIFAGTGPEYISTRLGADGFGGSLDSTYDFHIAFEVGAHMTFQINRLDVGGGLLIRSGTESEVDASDVEDLTYFYFMFRLEGEIGYRVVDAFRVYGGLRYSLYNSEWENNTPNSDFEAEFDIPVGFFLGAEIGTGAVRGRFETCVLDAYGFSVSITWTF